MRNGHPIPDRVNRLVFEYLYQRFDAPDLPGSDGTPACAKEITIANIRKDVVRLSNVFRRLLLMLDNSLAPGSAGTLCEASGWGYRTEDLLCNAETLGDALKAARSKEASDE